MRFATSLLSILLFLGTLNAQTPRMEKARGQLHKGQAKKALVTIQEDIDQTGFNEDNATLKSEILLYVNADQCWDNIQLTIEKFPTSAKAYMIRGRFYYELREMENSYKDLTKALELCRDDSMRYRVYLSRSATCHDNSSHDHCIADCKEALKLRPNSIEVLNNLSASYFREGNSKASIEILLQMKSIDSTFTGTYVNLGYQFQQMENYIEAERYLLEGLKIEPKDAFMLNNLGYTQFKLGKVDEAIKSINKSIAVNPSNSYCYRNLALIYAGQKNNLKACENINKALGLKFTEMYGEEMKVMKQQMCL
ncbi:MAG: tetratricopeptide repeat protein [Bacteroidia bacterium]|jgi:tetratricopeptide (TPR) repeat protein